MLAKVHSGAVYEVNAYGLKSGLLHKFKGVPELTFPAEL